MHVYFEIKNTYVQYDLLLLRWVPSLLSKTFRDLFLFLNSHERKVILLSRLRFIKREAYFIRHTRHRFSTKYAVEL